MKYQIIGKNIDVTDAISEVIKKKLFRIERLFKNHDEIICRAVVRSYKLGAKIEITIFDRSYIFRAEVTDEDLYAAVDLAIDKLEDQLRKNKTKLERRYEHDGLGINVMYEEFKDAEEQYENAEVVRTKNFELKPITIDEAITRMEMLGHSFFLYLDTDDEKIGVVYKRDDGGYGLIQADNDVKL